MNQDIAFEKSQKVKIGPIIVFVKFPRVKMIQDIAL